jgi:hypothetical protein
MNQYDQQQAFDQNSQPNGYNEVAPIPQPRAKTGLALVMARLGMGSFMVSMLVHAIFIILAVFFFFQWVKPPAEPKPDFIPGGGGGGGQNGEVAHKIKTSMRRTVSAALTSKRITANTATSTFTLPDTADMPAVPLPSDSQASSGTGGGAGGGHGKGIGKGIGDGTGPGRGIGKGIGTFSLIPTIMKGRCTPAERLRMVQVAGGNEALEEGVKKSLSWLKTQQNSNGSWGDKHNVAMTGFALLCYLGHCEDTQSTEYGTQVSLAISYLVNVGMANDGKLASDFGGNPWCYEHGIATYALAEALTFSKNLKFPISNLEDVVTRAGQTIIDGQNPNGSWAYKFDSSSSRNDLSVAGWQMQALKAVKASGVKVDGLDATMRKAVEYLGNKVGENGAYIDDGMFAYSGKKHSPALSGVGVLCLQQWGKPSSQQAKDGIKYIYSGLKDRDGEAKGKDAALPGQVINTYDYKTNCDLYAFYYSSQAMRNAGGSEWAAMNKAILEEILPNQQADGSFAMPAKMPHFTTKIYAQCLNTLIMEVYYRFLPATSAGSGSGGFGGGLDRLR